MRVAIEVGPKQKKVVAVAREWVGLERGGATEAAAVERLLAYVPRYVTVAQQAGVDASDLGTSVEVVERYAGPGSTDFWGISFGFSAFDRQPMSDAELAREIALMRACWGLFDDVRARVSAEMRTGPRGGGRARDHIVRHVVLNEQQQWAKKLGLRRAEGVMPSDAELAVWRDEYCVAIGALHAEGKMARSWPLRYLIRHTGYHTLDHTWEMEDKDLTATHD